MIKWNGLCPNCGSDNVECTYVEGKQLYDGTISDYKCIQCGEKFQIETTAEFPSEVKIKTTLTLLYIFEDLKEDIRNIRDNQTVVECSDDDDICNYFDQIIDDIDKCKDRILWLTDPDKFSRCEKCNKYFKDEELEFVEGHGVICNFCKLMVK